MRVSRHSLLFVAICVSIGLGVFAVQALGSFGSAKHFPTGNFPLGIAVGKLNRDSHPDLAVVSGGNVAVLLGNGLGGFGRAKHVTAGKFPDGVAIGNLNGDGKPDLAVANHNSNNVSILTGHGDGTFGKARNFAAGTVPTSIAIGRFNGDNRPDLAVANDFANGLQGGVSILLGHGDGTFGPPTDYPVGGIYPTSIAIGKFSGDANPDLAVAVRASDNVSILLGHGDGTFRQGHELRRRRRRHLGRDRKTQRGLPPRPRHCELQRQQRRGAAREGRRHLWQAEELCGRHPPNLGRDRQPERRLPP